MCLSNTTDFSVVGIGLFVARPGLCISIIQKRFELRIAAFRRIDDTHPIHRAVERMRKHRVFHREIDSGADIPADPGLCRNCAKQMQKGSFVDADIEPVKAIPAQV